MPATGWTTSSSRSSVSRSRCRRRPAPSPRSPRRLRSRNRRPRRPPPSSRRHRRRCRCCVRVVAAVGVLLLVARRALLPPPLPSLRLFAARCGRCRRCLRSLPPSLRLFWRSPPPSLRLFWRSPPFWRSLACWSRRLGLAPILLLGVVGGLDRLLDALVGGAAAWRRPSARSRPSLRAPRPAAARPWRSARRIRLPRRRHRRCGDAPRRSRRARRAARGRHRRRRRPPGGGSAARGRGSAAAAGGLGSRTVGVAAVLADGRDQLALAHARRTLDAELAGERAQVGEHHRGQRGGAVARGDDGASARSAASRNRFRDG